MEIRYNNIKLTRGDDAEIILKVYTSDNQLYIPKKNDKQIFTVYKKNTDGSVTPILEKFFIDNKLILSSEDTYFINAGLYYWNCQYIFGNDNVKGDNNISNIIMDNKNIIICKGNFRLLDIID